MINTNNTIMLSGIKGIIPSGLDKKVSIVIDDEEIIKAIEELEKAKDMEREAASIKKKATAIINKALLERNIRNATTGDIDIEIQSVKRSVFNTDEFKKDNPTVYPLYIKESNYNKYNLKRTSL